MENGIIKDIKKQHTFGVKCIKKIYHPKYGESLLSAANDKTIKLWSIREKELNKIFNLYIKF